MFRLAHVTDPHFRSWDGVRPADFLGKRAVGALNLLLNRRRHHRMELLAALGDDLRSLGFDHVALTGDLSNVSLDSEFAAARRWIERVSPEPRRVTVIPGNHDTYVEEVVRRRGFETAFARYLAPDAPAGTAGTSSAGSDYPFAHVRDGIALVGVNSCVPTGDLGAWGVVGDAQAARLEALLGRDDIRSLVRVVLVHHPLVMQKGGEERNLRDRGALCALLARTGADLVLHGHDHRDERVTLAGPAGVRIPVVGAGSASYAGHPDRRARYNVYEIDGRAITLVTRAHDEPSGAFREVRRERIAG